MSLQRLIFFTNQMTINDLRIPSDVIEGEKLNPGIEPSSDKLNR